MNSVPLLYEITLRCNNANVARALQDSLPPLARFLMRNVKYWDVLFEKYASNKTWKYWLSQDCGGRPLKWLAENKNRPLHLDYLLALRNNKSTVPIEFLLSNFNAPSPFQSEELIHSDTSYEALEVLYGRHPWCIFDVEDFIFVCVEADRVAPLFIFPTPILRQYVTSYILCKAIVLNSLRMVQFFDTMLGESYRLRRDLWGKTLETAVTVGNLEIVKYLVENMKALFDIEENIKIAHIMWRDNIERYLTEHLNH